jgi:predicted homoserine dehydrogenase-like protein
MGRRAFYVFYTPYHLPHVQIASTIARATLFNDATVAHTHPFARLPPLQSVIEGRRDYRWCFGGFMTYGLIENAKSFSAAKLLPAGVAAGCRLVRAIERDKPISYADVALPDDRLVDRLRAEQVDRFGHAS